MLMRAAAQAAFVSADTPAMARVVITSEGDDRLEQLLAAVALNHVGLHSAKRLLVG